ncbi:MAG: protein kinase [Deltaproteobacteria bacterium]|nr:MAG: protein kinase [Deltaproteobacteria bacterium]
MTKFQPIRFGKYLILDKIASGGMAELFRAKITSVEGFEKLVAIKKILPNLTQDSNLINMFIDEAKLAAMLTHQNIVQIYDLGSMEGAYFIAMEYIHGKDLRVRSNKSKEKGLPLPLEYALYITCRICSGLDYSHNLKDFKGNPLKLIHRDISPQNILVTYEGEVKIVDFGIAKAARKTADTREGLIKGKVAYMSPEQAAGKTIDHRSDIFSAGILLYEMITGVRMFDGADLNVLDRVRKADFQEAETIVSDLPAEVSEILRRALAKIPDRRYKSCAAMLADLEECLSSFTVRPSAEGLSHYMKALFAEEIAAEAAALLKIEAELSSLQKEVVSEGKTKTLHILEHIEPVLAKKTAPTPSTHRLWLGTWAVAMVAVAIVLAVLFKEKRVPTVVEDTVATSVKTSKLPSPSAVPPAPVSAETEKESNPPEASKREQAMEAFKKEQFAKAAALFELALANKPEDKSKIATPYAQALVGGSTSMLDTNPKQAESLLHKAIKLDPENPEAFFYLGKLYTSEKDYVQAIQAYDKAINLDPSSPDAFFNLGFLYYARSDYSKAEAMFLKVTELQPAYLDEAYFNLAVVQNLQEKKEESIENLERALEVNPNNDRAKKYLLRLRRTSKNDKKTNHSENKVPGIARTGTPLDHCWLCNS